MKEIGDFPLQGVGGAHEHRSAHRVQPQGHERQVPCVVEQHADSHCIHHRIQDPTRDTHDRQIHIGTTRRIHFRSFTSEFRGDISILYAQENDREAEDEIEACVYP